MPKALTKSDGYKTLVKKITREFAELEVLVKNSVAKGHWNVGKYIDEHLLDHKERAEYGGNFYIKLAKDTGRDPATLSLSVRFYRAYPIFAAPQKLTWEHYKGLLTVKDKNKRKELERNIIRHGWNTKQFRKYLSVKHKLAAQMGDDKPAPRLVFTRGRLHTCQIVKANDLFSEKGPLALDLGFRLQYEIPRDAPKLKEGDTVELVFVDGQLTGARKIEIAKDELFTYKAHVDEVIDADTYWVCFDFRCAVSLSQKLRLRGINCPEIGTPEGKKAKRFVESRLRDCDFIVVKTYKDRSDKFDRYLADIFYLPGEIDAEKVAREGKFLNQELLDEHLAVAYE